MNTVCSNGKKVKSSKKEKELAKKKAAEDTAISFFKGPGSSLLSLTNQNCSPNSSFTTLAPGVQGEAPSNSLSSFASPIPSTSGNKYPQFIPLETPPSKYDHQSMFDLLNSPLDGDDICFVSCQKSPEDTLPSSVGSLFKSSMGVLDICKQMAQSRVMMVPRRWRIAPVSPPLMSPWRWSRKPSMHSAQTVPS